MTISNINGDLVNKRQNMALLWYVWVNYTRMANIMTNDRIVVIIPKMHLALMMICSHDMLHLGRHNPHVQVV